MFLQFPEPALGRTRSTRKNSVRVAEFLGTGMSRPRWRFLITAVRLDTLDRSALVNKWFCLA